MPNLADMKWFKQNFHNEVEAAIMGTPFSLDLIVAIACQETGHIWPALRKRQLTRTEFWRLCWRHHRREPRQQQGPQGVPEEQGGTLWQSKGQEMFGIARKALADMAQPFRGSTRANPNKFCHGFGVFQFDLQFFNDEPDYFLERRYEKFSGRWASALAS